MSQDWYDNIAIRNNGYRTNASYSIVGISGEDVFEESLINMLLGCGNVLDAGCGHGEFTIKMGEYTKRLIGMDNSKNLLSIANELLVNSNMENVEFVYAWTHDMLPFADNQFDMVYSRRGPTSIIGHSRILKSGGIIFGIHSAALDLVKKRLEDNNFINIEIEIYDKATMHFRDDIEFSKYLTDIPGNPDYFLPENIDELKNKIKEHTINGEIITNQWRYIWKAEKP